MEPLAPMYERQVKKMRHFNKLMHDADNHDRNSLEFLRAVRIENSLMT
ncbi:hypothetical protein Bind_3880 (plasmid) [Beijerinckia indica subsp. indica ATCC 9039]|uniref:Uncharacterized protein n=1 Tax=Beijerinckia indica subsp. indica (strain ATCC 9039 / DSM 1715 / NCIMB 8712) TaxID=395963 RepID=B2ILK9_BEII9|nr:hypothetical protein Bind_3880 [Beijerinckia indica subsp. indica ATCC 9039]